MLKIQKSKELKNSPKKTKEKAIEGFNHLLNNLVDINTHALSQAFQQARMMADYVDEQDKITATAQKKPKIFAVDEANETPKDTITNGSITPIASPQLR